MKVELRPHVAKKRHPVGGGFIEREVHFDQCYVLVDGKQVGWYCGKLNEEGTYEHGRFLSFTEYQPPDVQKMLAEEVEKVIKGPVGNYQSVPKPEHEKKTK